MASTVGLRVGVRCPAVPKGRPSVCVRSTTPSPRDHADNEIERNDQVYEAAPVSTSGLSAFVRNIERSFQHAPRVRVRIAKDRTSEQLVDLVVLNEKLRGADPVMARMKLESIRKSRELWERVSQHVLRRETTATIEEIEALAAEVERTMSEQALERRSIGSLNAELSRLQSQLEVARSNLAVTETRVAANVARISQLENQASTLQTSYRDAASDVIAAVASTSTDPRALEFSVTAPAPQPETQRARLGPVKRSAGLETSLDLEDELKEMWMPVAFSSQLEKGTMIPFELFEEPWVLFRGENGIVGCLRDECAHRACPLVTIDPSLSLGKVIGNRVSCGYHGWEFAPDGNCDKMPSTVTCKGVSVSSLPVVEEGGFVWAYPGKNEPPPTRPLEGISPPEGYKVHAEICMEVPVDHGLLIENLLDLAHAPFTHVNTFAKGWPVPDAVRFNASRLLGGDWHPYPIQMSFEPPCMTISKIGLDRPGKPTRGGKADDCDKHLHQLHVCLPSKRGHTRLLYRMSMDFLGWMQGLPYMDKVWRGYADAVLGEDLVLVLGQQDRLLRGGDTWQTPVSYDKMAVRYRRWRNSLKSEAGEDRSALKMDAGEMFMVDELQEAEAKAAEAARSGSA